MTFVVAISMPKGCRPMTDAEIARIKWGQMLDVLDTHNGTVAKVTTVEDAKNGSVRVRFRGGHQTVIGAADPHEQFVAITTQLADELGDPNNSLAVALRASQEIAKLKGRCRKLEEALKAQADAIQGMPTREQYEALMADVAQLQQEYRILRMVKAS